MRNSTLLLLFLGGCVVGTPPADDSGAVDPEQGCVESGGTVVMFECCSGTPEFPDTCSTGACGCSPDDSDPVAGCDCPQGTCFDGVVCI
jgi:hypothetical protein